MRKADLHIHTTASDGLLSPNSIVDLAYRKNVNIIAITDHDTVTGISKAISRARLYSDLEVIPGIEISSNFNNFEIHILGYFIDYNFPPLIEITAKLKDSRIYRGYEIIKKLNGLGINIKFEDIQNPEDPSFVGRPHIARALFKNGYVNSTEEAFKKYLGYGCPAYVDRYKLTLEQSIDLIHRSGGVAVLAHPGLLHSDNVVKHAIKSNIDGIEVIHSKHSQNQIIKYNAIAENHDLIKTGGSDCHGYSVNSKILMGEYFTDDVQVERLRKKSNYYKQRGGTDEPI